MSKLLVVFVLLAGLTSVQAQPLPDLPEQSTFKYDSVGSLDATREGMITISDEVYQMTNLTNCFDLNGRKDIGCFGLKKAKWVGVKTYGGHSGSIQKIKAVYFISESDYLEFLNDD